MSMYAYLMSQFGADAARTAAAERQDAMALPQAADTLRMAAERSRAQIEAARDKAWERGRQMKLDDLFMRKGEQDIEAGAENIRHARAVNPINEQEAGARLEATTRANQENAATSEGRVASANKVNLLRSAEADAGLADLPAKTAAEQEERGLRLSGERRKEELGAKYDEQGIKVGLNLKKAEANQHNASAAYQSAHAKEIAARTAALENPDSPDLGPRVKVRDISDRYSKLENAWKMEAAVAAAANLPFTKPMPTPDDARASIAADLGKDLRFNQGEAFRPAQDPAILALGAKHGAKAYVSPTGKVMMVKGGDSMILPGTNAKSIQQDAAAAQPGAPVTGPRPSAGKPKQGITLSDLFGNNPDFPTPGF